VATPAGLEAARDCGTYRLRLTGGRCGAAVLMSEVTNFGLLQNLFEIDRVPVFEAKNGIDRK